VFPVINENQLKSLSLFSRPSASRPLFNEVAMQFYSILYNHGFTSLLVNCTAKVLLWRFCLYRNMLTCFANWITKTASPHILIHVHILYVLKKCLVSWSIFCSPHDWITIINSILKNNCWWQYTQTCIQFARQFSRSPTAKISTRLKIRIHICHPLRAIFFHECMPCVVP
jgi:hypothetical protein